MIMIIKNRKITVVIIFSRRFPVSFDVCFSVDPLSLILRKAQAACEFSGSKKRINHLSFMDNLKLYSRNEKELDLLVLTIHVFT